MAADASSARFAVILTPLRITASLPSALFKGLVLRLPIEFERRAIRLAFVDLDPMPDRRAYVRRFALLPEERADAERLHESMPDVPIPETYVLEFPESEGERAPVDSVRTVEMASALLGFPTSASLTIYGADEAGHLELSISGFDGVDRVRATRIRSKEMTEITDDLLERWRATSAMVDALDGTAFSSY